tara:strand:- start:350 stop:499 length:150 start_codon:yes stop_codon:yes gene_type:complete
MLAALRAENDMVNVTPARASVAKSETETMRYATLVSFDDRLRRFRRNRA